MKFRIENFLKLSKSFVYDKLTSFQGIKPSLLTKYQYYYSNRPFFSYRFLNRIETYQELLNRYKILIRGEMVKNRTAIIHLLSYKHRFTYNYSNLAGHGSFIALAISYLGSDFFTLRLYAMAGITMSIIFQYYRPIPLWIPIRWNFLFLFINGVMVIIILIDEYEASKITADESNILQLFNNHGNMRAVDFKILMSIADKHTIKAGERLVTQGYMNSFIHFVKSGNLTVERNHETVGYVEKYQFVGEMSFLSWEGNIGAQLNARKRDIQKAKRQKPYYDTFISFINSLSNHIQWSLADPLEYEEFYELKRKEQFYTFNLLKKKESNDDLPKGELGHADTICVDECEVYSWTFQALHDLMATYPHIGVVVEKTLAADLNKKLFRQWKAEPMMRYKNIMAGILIDGVITGAEKNMLSRYRTDNNISEDVHVSILEEFGWTAEDFENGVIGAPDQKKYIDYENAMAKVLLDKKTVTEETKSSLRQMRKENHITDDAHVRILHNNGWSIDEYEVSLGGESNGWYDTSQGYVRTFHESTFLLRIDTEVELSLSHDSAIK